jgi:hypothetical protein
MTTAGRVPGRDRGAVVPDAEVRTYYDRPVVKPPVWTFEVPWYFFAGGLAGASSILGWGAALTGNEELARTARRAAAAGALVSPVLLVSDLGVPERFLNMVRVFRPTSPLNMGSWLLSVYVPNAVGAAVMGRPARPFMEASAAAAGLGMTTYTAVLLADTAVPIWHEARRELPFVFAGSSGASAGAVGMIFTVPKHAAPARRLTLLGVALEQAAEKAMERRLGDLARPLHEGAAGRFARTARACTLTGAALTALAGRRRSGAVVGGALVVAGSVLQRWAVFKAGFQSAAEPRHTVKPQRDRLAGRLQPAGRVPSSTGTSTASPPRTTSNARV